MVDRSSLRLGILVGIVLLIVVTVAHFLGRKPHVELPKGMQEISGTLTPVPLSPTRRGTHVLVIDGKPFVFVESDQNLKPMEGIRVTARGTFEENIDPNLLPVLVATDVRAKAMALKQWKPDTLPLTLNTPETWAGGNDAGALRFLMPGFTHPILRVVLADTDELPAGQHMAVGGEKAVSVRNGSGETVYVQKGGKIIAFDFMPTSAEERAEQEYEFKQVVLRSVVFAGTSSSRSSGSGGTTVAGSGSVLGQPCGGDAGILCPSGQYCETTDYRTNIGRCKTLR